MYNNKIACEVLNRVMKRQYEFIEIESRVKGVELSDFLDEERVGLAEQGILCYHFQIHPDWATTRGMGYSVELLRAGGMDGEPEIKDGREITRPQMETLKRIEDKKYSSFKTVTAAQMKQEGIFPAAIGFYNMNF